jgi:PAS domain S-box-containing protein
MKQKYFFIMISELKNILRLLDRFVGHYPIYLYLTDAHNTIIWFNKYMAINLPEIHIGQNLQCSKALWPCEIICYECLPAEKHITTTKVEKNLVKARIDSLGEERYIEFFSMPVMEKENEVEGILRVGIDVTDNEKMQEKLRQKEKLYTSIVDTSTDGIIFLNNDGYIKSWNKGAQAIFGYTPEEIIGEFIETIIPPENLQMGELDYIREELAERGFLEKYETRRLRKDGKPIYVDISCSQIYDEDGRLVGTSEIIKDIQAQKLLEFELLRTIHELSKLNELNEIIHRIYNEEEILRAILIAITAGEGLRFNRALILLVNEEEKMLKGHIAIGPSDKEEAQKIWNELSHHQRYLKDIVQAYGIDLEGADKKVNEIVTRINVPLDRSDHILIQGLYHKQAIQVKNGRVIPPAKPCVFDIDETSLFDKLNNNSFVIAPLYSKKEPLGVIIADNCITGREISIEDVESLKLFANQASSAIENARLHRALEDRIKDLQNAYQQLAENQKKLLRTERLAGIGEMSARVAHEIRNPLVSIGGFARLIEKKIDDQKKAKKYVGIIKEQVDNLENILDNILTTANPPKPQKKAIDINRIIHRVADVLKQALKQRNINLTMELEDFKESIFGDERLLYQAFLNILKNAIEALDSKPERGKIRVITRSRGHWVEVKISDNGPGIEQNLLSKIFQTFFTTKSRGTGLGLSIVQQIVESHDGEIKVKSKLTQGTNFYIRLPVVMKPETVPKTAQVQ